MLKKKFVITIKQHRQLGVIIAPFVIEIPLQLQDYFNINTVVTAESLVGLNMKLKPEQLQIVQLCDKYSDENLQKLFAKKKKGQDFFNSLTPDFIKDRIRPYIEKYVYQIVLLALKSETPVFFKENAYQKVYLSDALIIEPQPATTVFNFEKKADHSRYFLTIKHNNEVMHLTHSNARIINESPCLLALNDKIYRFDDIDGNKLKPFLSKEYIEIPQSAEERYFDTFVKNSIKKYDVQAKGFLIDVVETQPQPILSLEKDLTGLDVLNLKFRYHTKIYNATHNNTVTVIQLKNTKNYHFQKIIRNIQAERNIIQQLAQWGITQNRTGFFSVTDKSDILEWINQNAHNLKTAGIETQKTQADENYFLGELDLDVQIKQVNDWFDLYGYVIFGQFKIPFKKLRKNILKSDNRYVLPNGEIAILPQEWFARFQNLFLMAKETNEALRLKHHHHTLIQESIKGIDDHFMETLKQQYTSKPPEYPLPAQLNATLRNYQIEGFRWINHLRINNLGGCLADDMGLGKTLQTLSVLAKAKEEKANMATNTQPTQPNLFEAQNNNQNQLIPSLIVMPASLIHNWRNEVAKFTPQLKTLDYTGPERHQKIKYFKQVDIILSTYGTVRNDIEKLKHETFFYTILDESQYIKNHDSKTYKALLQIHAHHYLIMTGTPIENSLNDLWSQLNFTNNGLLGNATFFKETFIRPIEKQQDEYQRERLQKLIAPFILRRHKKDVAKELPPVTEQVVLCEMNEAQKKRYDTEKSKARNFLLEEKRIQKHIIVLQTLNKLRQIACHPIMIDKTYNEDSGKMEAIMEAIENATSQKHKVLIFSSYVKHLELIENQLKQQKVGYTKLTGALNTAKRKTTVHEFINNPEILIFLISIKAGGVGLNLTVADYVFIIDPWWNPAVEQQAIDRTHRIGQQQNVMVYRFISKDTVEEKILLLQQKKRQLAQIVDETNGLASLTENEIETLFE